jgi:hypothetical protein
VTEPTPPDGTGRRSLRELRPFAILVGSLVDNLGTTAWVLAYAAIRGVPLTTTTPTAEAQGAFDALLRSPLDSVVLFVIGMSFVVIGAYAAGRMAKRAPMLHAVGVSIISLAIGVIDIFMGGSPAPLWYRVSGLVLTLPAGWLGGRLAMRNTEVIELPTDGSG